MLTGVVLAGMVEQVNICHLEFEFGEDELEELSDGFITKQIAD